MNPAEWPGGLAYLVVYVAAIIEGEFVFVAASILVAAGKLNGVGVYLAAALGGSTGDQIYYYVVRGALHGHLRRWLARFPALARRHEAIVQRVHRHQAVMILACRFLPGLRVAIPVACAYAGVRAPVFSGLDLLSALAWAATIMMIVTWGGPTALARIGLRGWWALIAPGVLLLLFFWWLGKASTRIETKAPD